MTGRYAVIGNPIGHTKSPFIHTEFARQTGEDIRYEAIEAPLDGFTDIARAFFDAGGKGLNVTVPFKVAAHDMADVRREAAAICGASNCLTMDGGRLVAENFDGVGLLRDIAVNLGVRLAGARVLIAGAGGATRGAVAPFLAAGVGEVVIANRTVEKAEAIRDLLADRGAITAVGYDGIEDGFDLVLNSTSASLSGKALPIPASAFDGCALAYDLAYGKGRTPFLAQAEAGGAGCIADGVGMLVEQAAEAFLWWRGIRPDTAPVIAALTVPLV